LGPAGQPFRFLQIPVIRQQGPYLRRQRKR
jgi:hypothetical protein